MTIIYNPHPTDWIPFTGFNTGWESIENAAYKIYPDGEVVFKGGLARSVTTPATSLTALILPVEIRPIYFHAFRVVSNINEFDGTGSTSMTIRTDGEFKGLGNSASDRRYFHLEQIRYFLT